MERKNLGIIQIDLPKIVLDDAFGAGAGVVITSLLSEETKQLIKNAPKMTKIIYVNLPDGVWNNDESDSVKGKLIPCYVCNEELGIIQTSGLRTQSDAVVEGIEIYYDIGEDEFYIYS